MVADAVSNLRGEIPPRGDYRNCDNPYFIINFFIDGKPEPLYELEEILVSYEIDDARKALVIEFHTFVRVGSNPCEELKDFRELKIVMYRLDRKGDCTARREFSNCRVLSHTQKIIKGGVRRIKETFAFSFE